MLCTIQTFPIAHQAALWQEQALWHTNCTQHNLREHICNCCHLGGLTKGILDFFYIFSHLPPPGQAIESEIYQFVQGL